ncbi:uncharacterized protein LOC123555856 [Mercenaria mercenaria]|uniref:uncharacterized protein LOC123555856 n=1 Tax=Mercenaria mercenaria TaxID=6596 RepID=UPI00234E643B|nr:uncharacterized protein LOC123555856 [Mercenaria mercenaria]
MTRRLLPASKATDTKLSHLSGPHDSSSSSETNVKVKVTKRPKKGNEYCLSKAIQAHVMQLVDTMPFSECELADEVVKTGCVTEDECKAIRENKDRKTQVRDIILLVKTRSYETMEKFLNSAKRHCPTTVDSIWERYERNINENRKPKRPCPFCNIKMAVDIRRVVDGLWGAEIIDDTLVREIMSSRDVVGRQDKYWDAILDACCKNKLKGLPSLYKALESNGHYTHIVQGLRYHFHYNEHWFCTCSSSILNLPCAKSRTSSFNSETSEMPASSPSEDELNVIDLDDEPDEVNDKGKGSKVNSVNSVPCEAMSSKGSIACVSRNTYDPPRQNIRGNSRPFNYSGWRKLVFLCFPKQSTTIEEETDS